MMNESFIQRKGKSESEGDNSENPSDFGFAKIVGF